MSVRGEAHPARVVRLRRTGGGVPIEDNVRLVKITMDEFMRAGSPEPLLAAITLAGGRLDVRERLERLIPDVSGERAGREYARNAAVVTTKPGGAGRPSRVMSARLAPLPPSSAFTSSQSSQRFSTLGS
jgi:hypothetical protein